LRVATYPRIENPLAGWTTGWYSKLYVHEARELQIDILTVPTAMAHASSSAIETHMNCEGHTYHEHGVWWWLAAEAGSIEGKDKEAPSWPPLTTGGGG
jgi:hypothetical protein